MGSKGSVWPTTPGATPETPNCADNGVQDHRPAGLAHRPRPPDRGARLCGHRDRVLAQVPVRGDRRPDVLDPRAAADPLRVDFPAAGPGVKPRPNLYAVPVAVLGDPLADGRGPVDWAPGQVPQRGRFTGPFSEL